MDPRTDWQKWIRQSLPRTDYMRGGATVWPRGGTRLLDDALGPTMHLHDDASEIFYFVGGRCRLEGDAREMAANSALGELYLGSATEETLHV